MVDAVVSTGMTPRQAESGWWAPLILGIVVLLFGILLIAHPAETSIWVAWVVGVYWFIGGVINLVMMFIDHRQWGWKLALGILGMLAGLVVLDVMGQNPLLGAVGLATVYVWILGIQGIAYGMIELIQAFQGRGWGVGILGVLSILFGGFLLFNPFPASLALPFVFGIIALVGGIAAIVMAFRAKSRLSTV